VSSFVDSKHQKLSKDEIIAIAAKETGGKYTPEQIKASLMSEIHQMQALLMQEGNTLFIIHKSPEDPTVGLFRALNADTIQNYLKNCLVFTKAIGLMGFKYMVTVFDDPSLINIFKHIGRNQPFKNMGYAVQKSKDGKQYKITAYLGDTKKGGLPDKAMPKTQGAL
jgi:hypothetical protein